MLAQNFGTKFAGEKEQSSDNLGHTYVSRAGHRMSLNCYTVAISAASFHFSLTAQRAVLFFLNFRVAHTGYVVNRQGKNKPSCAAFKVNGAIDIFHNVNNNVKRGHD